MIFGTIALLSATALLGVLVLVLVAGRRRSLGIALITATIAVLGGAASMGFWVGVAALRRSRDMDRL